MRWPSVRPLPTAPDLASVRGLSNPILEREDERSTPE